MYIGIINTYMDIINLSKKIYQIINIILEIIF